MHWNLNAHKTLHFKYQKSGHFSGMNLYRFSRLRYITCCNANLQQTGVNFVGECNAFFQRNLTLWTLSFQDLSLFQMKYSVPNLLLWLLHMYFSFRLTTYIPEGKKTSNKNSCDIKYFTWKAQNMNQWNHENMLNLVSWNKTLECSKTVSCFSLQNSMNPAWQCVTV